MSDGCSLAVPFSIGVSETLAKVVTAACAVVGLVSVRVAFTTV